MEDLAMSSVDRAWATMVANLERNTGRSLDAWVALVHASGIEKHGQIVAMLKADHGLTHGFANMIAMRAKEAAEGGPPSDDAVIDSHYEGARGALRPLYERVMEEVRRFGLDVETAPKKTYVSVRRRKQFACIGPAGVDRLEVGLNLPDVPPAGRLEPATGMVDRRVRLSDAAEIDAELIGWLRAAYERA
jgi:predicted transport protein